MLQMEEENIEGKRKAQTSSTLMLQIERGKGLRTGGRRKKTMIPANCAAEMSDDGESESP